MTLRKLLQPGLLYNIGDGIAFAAGLSAAALGASGVEAGAGFWHLVWGYAMGSPAAIAVTIATIFFFGSGTLYMKAWANGFPPDRRIVRRADLVSVIGALALGLGMCLVGNPVLAALAGLMHAGGKLGSAIAHSPDTMLFGTRIKLEDGSRDIVLLSRVPAMVAAIWGVHGADAPALVLLSSVIVCYALWILADYLLLAPGSWIAAALARVLPPRQLQRQ